MPNQSLNRIFLAHASEDKPIMRHLYESLKQRGYHPWLDEKDLIPGQEWRVEIPKVIRNSSIFVACLSSRSVTKDGYIQREFRMALNECANKPPGTIYLIPIRLDDCIIPDLRQNELGVNLRDYQWLNYFESDGFEKLISAIQYQFSDPNAPTSPYHDLSIEYVKADACSNKTVKLLGQVNYHSENLDDEVTLDMIQIPGGNFMMGSSETEKGRSSAESPLHQVNISEFMMGKYPVTQQQWQIIAALPKIERDISPVPSIFKGSFCPIVRISWYDTQEFCARLSNLTGQTYRLPSEAEWEYACRAGTEEPFYFGETITKDLANCARNEIGTTNVSQYPPNAFGLYSMHGNVLEWCQDTWHDNYDAAPTDGSAWLGSYQDERVSRGGSYGHSPCYCRSASRHRHKAIFLNNNIGFRVCYSTF
ncbi:TIR domain-containing protein [Leptolyngbyaceae cyanobacterium CCMR0082]|uniref:TIR domain-containing protein n=1 Tax=Adonisia turfae CCMR0082 TaxID=2304604 RepID=A0A6M0S9H9_9CYAN|nr:SUMF1/EgtB/PvdO family nonheme iron enzyme [Adonisia turfae]NEZ65135.1 TIR domain-containing protein [Adonisia turfae CCMR0082]